MSKHDLNIPREFRNFSDRGLLEIILEKTFYIEERIMADETKIDAALAGITNNVDAIQTHVVTMQQQIANGNFQAAQAEADSILVKIQAVNDHVATIAGADAGTDATSDPAAVPE
jgi:hypothetical protein